jgi:hypothetical protein
MMTMSFGLYIAFIMVTAKGIYIANDIGIGRRSVEPLLSFSIIIGIFITVAIFIGTSIGDYVASIVFDFRDE